jgi:hypothetical protein
MVHIYYSVIYSTKTGGFPLLNMPSPDELDALFQKFKAALTHPELQKVIEEVQRLPEAQRTQVINTKLTPQALIARGIPISEGMSITTHLVEHPIGPAIGALRGVGGQSPREVRICIIVEGKQYCIIVTYPSPTVP